MLVALLLELLCEFGNLGVEHALLLVAALPASARHLAVATQQAPETTSSGVSNQGFKLKEHCCILLHNQNFDETGVVVLSSL